ncbi:MAG TPA: zf-HC2 domain-containing protein, partial [Thermoanaerobaculia bacterium]|nr:zf-HC2 domain-containing protein [Thermoanaerobaculia bacterium]
MACPDSETLAAYLDGRLFPEQRDRLEEHLAGCDACGTALADAVRFQSATDPSKDEEPVEGDDNAPRRRLLAVAAAIAALALPTAAWLALRNDWRPWQQDPRAPLIAATTHERSLQPR